MLENEECQKAKSYWYDQIMLFDGELAQYEIFIERLERAVAQAATSSSNTDNIRGVQAALSETRVLANAVRAKRDDAIDEFDMICEVEEKQKILIEAALIQASGAKFTTGPDNTQNFSEN